MDEDKDYVAEEIKPKKYVVSIFEMYGEDDLLYEQVFEALDVKAVVCYLNRGY